MIEKTAKSINDIDFAQNRNNKIKFKCEQYEEIYEYRVRYFKDVGDFDCSGNLMLKNPTKPAGVKGEFRA